MYARLDAPFRNYVDSLVQHAETALWPERRAALESFRRGIAKSDPEDLQRAAKALNGPLPETAEPAEQLYRALLTAYLERLGYDDISNPDQAALYRQSLDASQSAKAGRWFEAHPEHAAADSQIEGG